MNKFDEIEGEKGLFEIRKIKVLYEVISLEKGFCIKNLDTREIKVKESNCEKSNS